jgi:hypothetical protein
MLHDEWGLAPAFSSVEKFVAWLTLNGGRRGEAEIDDPEFAPAHFAQAKSQIERGDIDGAISRLRSACDSVPDACDYWFTLATQLQRIGKHDESTDAALRAFRSSWFFGMPSDAVLRTIRKEQGNSAFASDPLVTRSNELTTKFGGTKENRNYALLRECVADYLDRGCAVEALQLYQNYAFMMCSETTAFQERHSFALEVWRVEFSKLCGKHLRDARVAVT